MTTVPETNGFGAEAGFGGLPKRVTLKGYYKDLMRERTSGAGPEADYLAAVYNFVNHFEQTETLADEPHRLDWLSDVYRFVARKEIDGAIDALFVNVNRLLKGRKLSVCDDMLHLVDLFVGLLTVTLPATHELPARPRLVERVEARLREIAPTRVERLLVGLR
jgi:hypothetical protein